MTYMAEARALPEPVFVACVVRAVPASGPPSVPAPGLPSVSSDAYDVCERMVFAAFDGKVVDYVTDVTISPEVDDSDISWSLVRSVVRHPVREVQMTLGIDPRYVVVTDSPNALSTVLECAILEDGALEDDPEVDARQLADRLVAAILDHFVQRGALPDPS